jgi:mono/diheme cytochrome c family protein
MRWNVLLALLLVLSGAGHFLLQTGPSSPNVEILPEMVQSVAYESYSVNPNFPDGKTMQLPPPHTVARGEHEFLYGPSEDEAARAGRELSSPIAPDDSAALARGADRYGAFCRHCHGPTGRGDGPVAMRGFPAPPPFNSEQALQLQDGRIFHIITYGQKNMPAHRGQIPPEDRWRIVAHVRSLQRALTPAPQEAKP